MNFFKKIKLDRKKKCENQTSFSSLKLQQTKKGFTIGEVMVAVFILTFGIISAVFLSAKSIATITDSRNSIIAASLSQEGVELVRSVRDNSITQMTCDSSGGVGNERCTAFHAFATVSNNSYGWPSLAQMSDACLVDHTLRDGAVQGIRCTGIVGLNQLYLNDSTGFYSHEPSDIVTPFSRVIYIDYFDTETGDPFPPIQSDIDKIGAKITSVVIWSDDAELRTKIGNAAGVEQHCKIAKQCSYSQTKLTSWINFGE